MYFDVINKTSFSGGAVSVELLVNVELTGGASLNPYSIYAYLSTDPHIDPFEDKQVRIVH